jgi:hypothetical protein
MPFREALDLSHIVRKYEEHLGSSTAGINYVREGAPRHVEDAYDPIPKRLYEPPDRPGTGAEPALVGSGPRRCSTSRTMALAGPLFAWDPNRYYRDLGIPWPYVGATRKDLRLAYFDKGGQDSRRLTYCMTQLLNPEVRGAYDALPLGEQYLDDEYVQEALKLRAAAEASKRSETGDYTTAESVLDDWGYKLEPETSGGLVTDSSDSGESLDTVGEDEFDEDPHHETVGADWQYSFYLWKTTKWDTERLAEWQAALITELSERGISPTLAVGLMGNQPHPYAVASVDEEWVVFLNKGVQVSPDLASRAAIALHTQISAHTVRPAIESR